MILSPHACSDGTTIEVIWCTRQLTQQEASGFLDSPDWQMTWVERRWRQESPAQV